jgi:hypothetical protein
MSARGLPLASSAEASAMEEAISISSKRRTIVDHGGTCACVDGRCQPCAVAFVIVRRGTTSSALFFMAPKRPLCLCG